MDIIRATGSAVGRCPSVIANGLIWTVATAGGEGSTVTDQTRVTLARLDSLLAAARMRRLAKAQPAPAVPDDGLIGSDDDFEGDDT